MRRVPAGSYDRLSSYAALDAAWRRYRRGKRRRPAVALFEVDQEAHLLALARELQRGAFEPQPPRFHCIREPKVRLISVAPVRERVVHQAIYGELAPHFERSYIEDSFACRVGRGSHRAVLRLLERMRRRPWLLALDIRRYFLSIRHATLLELLAHRLHDRRLLALLTRILAAADGLYQPAWVVAALRLQDHPVPPATGVPIGSLLSQWWGNLYLDGLDHFIKRVLKVRDYQRYMDDLVLLGPDPATLRGWQAELVGWLQTERGLLLNHARTRLQPCTRPFDYLGYRISRAGLDPHPRLWRRLRQRLPVLAAGDPGRLRQALAAWRAVSLFGLPRRTAQVPAPGGGTA